MNLKRTYARLLRLYPKDYRFRFEVEMLETFDLVLEERHRAGILGFAARELTACLRGAVGEWIAKFKTDTSTRSRHLPDLRMIHLPWLRRETRSLSLRKFRCSSDTSQ